LLFVICYLLFVICYLLTVICYLLTVGCEAKNPVSTLIAISSDHQ